MTVRERIAWLFGFIGAFMLAFFVGWLCYVPIGEPNEDRLLPMWFMFVPWFAIWPLAELFDRRRWRSRRANRRRAVPTPPPLPPQNPR